MREYLKRVFIFSFGISLFLICYVLSFNIGQLDFYYKRISSPKQESLILGSSRSAQGLVPTVINEVLNPQFYHHKLYNFSFATSYSPYGATYLKSIKEKIEPNTTGGLFIITVDPGSVSCDGEPSLVDSKYSFLSHLNSVTANPNLDYILYSHHPYWTKLLYNLLFGKGYLHDDGWLEMKIPNDSLSRAVRLKAKLSGNYATKFDISEIRLDYLKKTITFLKKYGDVYLLIMPNHQLIVERELKSVPQFDKIISEIATYYSVPYLNLSNYSQYYEFTDGTHLTSESAKKLSLDIALWIKNTKLEEKL